MDLRPGRYQDVLRDVECDAVIVDSPYSKRTHEGHDAGASLANKAEAHWERSDGRRDPCRPRRSISYDFWTEDDVDEFVAFWAPRNRGWFVCLSDSELCGAWRAAFEAHGLCGFQPVTIFIPGMTVRMAGDGPSSWTIYANVARPRREPFSTWGTLPGGYTGTVGKIERAASVVAGAKPLWAMRAIVRDYSRSGDLVVDPCAGGGTTLAAAVLEGRRAIGAEVNPDNHRAAMNRLAGAHSPSGNTLSLFPDITTLPTPRSEECNNQP
jgi:hypothetical protein